MCLGHTIADVVGILGSLDIVLGDGTIPADRGTRVRWRLTRVSRIAVGRSLKKGD